MLSSRCYDIYDPGLENKSIAMAYEAGSSMDIGTRSCLLQPALAMVYSSKRDYDFPTHHT